MEFEGVEEFQVESNLKANEPDNIDSMQSQEPEGILAGVQEGEMESINSNEVERVDSKEIDEPVVTVDTKEESDESETIIEHEDKKEELVEVKPIEPKLEIEANDHVDTKEEVIDTKIESNELEKDPNADSSASFKSSEERKSWPLVWLQEHQVSVKVIELIYWKDLKQTGLVFGGILALLLSLAYYPFLCVVATFMKALLAVSFLYRIGMSIVNAVQKTNADHPLKHLLEEKIEFGEDFMTGWSENFRQKVNALIRYAQHIFLINSFIDSIKFAVVIWCISGISSCVSFLSLVTMPFVFLFTAPKFYDCYQDEVDKIVSIGKSKSLELFNMIDSKVPAKYKVYYHAKKIE